MNEDYNTYIHKDKLYHELDAKMLWSLGHYDGPMTGIAEHDGKIYYAHCHQCPDTWAPRYFWLYLLTKEEEAAERQAHEWFQKYYGFHTDFENGVKRRRKPLTTKEKIWDVLRIFKTKPWEAWRAEEVKLRIPWLREDYKKREAAGFFTIERTRENFLQKDGYMTKIELLYHSGYWDGPLSGVCRFQGKRRWFKCVHDYFQKTEDGSPLDMRIYAIYDLTAEEWKDEDYWHRLFEKNVGTHTSYDDTGQRRGEVFSSDTYHKFYDASKKAKKEGTRKAKELTEDKLIGYFDKSEMKFRSRKYRNYWIEGESPSSTHSINPHMCANHELVEWRNNAQKWDHFDSDFDGKSSGWAICIQPDGPDRGKPFWMIINSCPWCGAKLTTPKVE
jgi:hypothetical protein